MLKSIFLSILLFAGAAFAAQKPLEAKDQKTLERVFDQYEALHSSFFKYEGEKAQKDAAELADRIDKIKDPELSKLLEFSKGKLKEISSSKSREENNQNMHLVSLALIHVLNNYKVGEEYKAFQCPMVKKKWIQNTKDVKVVQNPYAPEMPNCGGLDS